jgi:hypothetical protein
MRRNHLKVRKLDHFFTVCRFYFNIFYFIRHKIKGIKISLTNDELGVYESRLELLNVNQTTRREFKCNSKINNQTVSKEISFLILGIFHLKNLMRRPIALIKLLVLINCISTFFKGSNGSWIIYGLILPIGIIAIVAITMVLHKRCCPSCSRECCLCVRECCLCLELCTHCCFSISAFNS